MIAYNILKISNFKNFLDVFFTTVFKLKVKEKFFVLKNYTEYPIEIFQVVQKCINGLKWVKLVLQAHLL